MMNNVINCLKEAEEANGGAPVLKTEFFKIWAKSWYGPKDSKNIFFFFIIL